MIKMKNYYFDFKKTFIIKQRITTRIYNQLVLIVKSFILIHLKLFKNILQRLQNFIDNNFFPIISLQFKIFAENKPYSQRRSTISNYEICNDKVYAFCVGWKLLWLKSGPFLPSAYIFMRVKLMEVARRRISVFVEIAAVFAAIFGLNSSCFVCYMVCKKVETACASTSLQFHPSSSCMP